MDYLNNLNILKISLRDGYMFAFDIDSVYNVFEEKKWSKNIIIGYNEVKFNEFQDYGKTFYGLNFNESIIHDKYFLVCPKFIDDFFKKNKQEDIDNFLLDFKNSEFNELKNILSYNYLNYFSSTDKDVLNFILKNNFFINMKVKNKNNLINALDFYFNNKEMQIDFILSLRSKINKNENNSLKNFFQKKLKIFQKISQV